jgi:hypothetical protein
MRAFKGAAAKESTQMEAKRNRRWAAVPAGVLVAVVLGLLCSQPSQAIPAFARKYGVMCYTCHLIPPVLNKTGYLFKRLGYRMPPEYDGTHPAPKITELDPEARWTITNSLALVTQGSFSSEKITGSSPSSNSAFNLDKAILFAGGSVPATGFSYFAEYKFYEGGTASTLEQAMVGYTWGRANSSVFGKAGQMHVQEGEGTRAAMMFSLFDDPAITLTNTSPINFTLDQHPVGINGGYTWASPYFKNIVGVEAKVTNGVNADGSEILLNQAGIKNSKDVWFDADYWFGPDGGLTFLAYHGNKPQDQNQGTPDAFSYNATIRRYGVFANYLFFDKLDLQGGYLRAKDDWRGFVNEPLNYYTGNAYRAEVDYYIRRGLVVMARYDRINQKIVATGPTHTQAWGVGGEMALTDLGNVIIRARYNQERDVDPVSAAVSTDKLFKVDLRLMW